MARGLLGFAAALALGSAWAAAPPPSASCGIGHYRVVAVPLQPAAINAAGEVAGTTSQHRAAVWSQARGLHELPLPAGFSHSEAVSINNRGDVVGTAFDAGFTRRQAFAVVDGVVTLLPGEQARAHHINDQGIVSGESQLPGNTATQPVLWAAGSVQRIPNCCGGSATGVDARTQVIGAAYDEQGRYYAYRWTASLGVERIGPAQGFSAAVVANERGEIVIQTFPGTLLYANGHATRVTLAPRYPSYAQAINDCSVIVGAFGAFSDAYRAFIWQSDIGFQDLNTRIPRDSGWTLESATGINDRGEIVGRGAPDGEEDGGFLLLPTPETTRVD
jgi:uncharacterized membrane protein